jgi:AAA15 family ATPase/GTPase
VQKINNIEIKNFKSIRQAEIKDCRRVNVFIGYPNVGKSNILEALGLYSILVENEHFSFTDICRVNHFSELFFNQNYRDAAQINFNETCFLNLVSDSHLSRITFDFRVGNNDKTSNVFGSEVVPSVDNGNNFYIQRGHTGYSEEDIPVSNVKKYQFTSTTKYQNNSSAGLSLPYGNNMLDILQKEAKLRKEIAGIFQEYNLKLLLDRTDQTIKFQKELSDGTAVSIPYHQVADTLRRLIFFKAAIQTNNNSILLFEEPESHMFPPYISKFTGDIISDENNNQYFIATHSPFVLNDFMEELDKEDLSIYAVGLKDGETIIRRLTDDEITEVYQYGVDLFFNLENYLKDVAV